MTDTMAPVSSAGGAFQSIYKDLAKQISEIDAQLELLGDPKTVGKTKIKNQMVDEVKDKLNSVYSGVTNFLGQFSDQRTVLSLFQGLVQQLSEKYEESLDTYVDAELAKQKKEPTADGKKPSESEVKQLIDARQKLWAKADGLKEMAINYNQGTADEFPTIKKFTGRNLPRGEREIDKYQWEMDGRPISGVDNQLGYVAETYAALIPDVKRMTTKDGKQVETTLGKLASLRDLIRSSNVDENGDVLKNLTSPPTTLKFRLGDHSFVGARPRVIVSTEPDTDDDEQSEEGETPTQEPV